MREASRWDHHSRIVMTVLIATIATKKVIPNMAKESILTAGSNRILFCGS